VRGELEEDIGQLSTLEHDVVESLREHEIVKKNIDAHFETKLTRGQQSADFIARFGGSWRFIGIFGAFLVVWIFLHEHSRTPPSPLGIDHRGTSLRSRIPG